MRRAMARCVSAISGTRRFDRRAGIFVTNLALAARRRLSSSVPRERHLEPEATREKQLICHKLCAVRCRAPGFPGHTLRWPKIARDAVHVMTRTITPQNKTRIRQSPLPVIGAVVAIILVVFYGWSQRGWLINVTDIESRDVDMQSQQLQRGFATELDDLYSVMGDYAIWTET